MKPLKLLILSFLVCAMSIFADSHPNIVFILADDIGIVDNTLSIYTIDNRPFMYRYSDKPETDYLSK